jgi:hypothetical protein
MVTLARVNNIFIDRSVALNKMGDGADMIQCGAQNKY